VQRALGLVLVMAAVAGCGGGEPELMVMEADAAFPSETLADWATYGTSSRP
jgi:hypothetical protein